ncbi:aminopeptidase Y precursor vacuolar [Colletotrichum asianum]
MVAFTDVFGINSVPLRDSTVTINHLRVRVRNRVARLVIARVLRDRRAGMQEPERLVEYLPEGRVVAAVGQHRRRDNVPLAGKVRLVDVLDDVGPRRRDAAVAAAVRVRHPEEALGHHVEVEVHQQVVDVGGREVRAVELRPEQAVLLGAPPREAHFVLGAVLGQGEEELEEEAGAGAWGVSVSGKRITGWCRWLTVVVDAGAGLHAVQVRSELPSSEHTLPHHPEETYHHNVVRIALLRLDKHILRNPLLHNLRLLEARRHTLSTIQPLLDPQPVREVDKPSRHEPLRVRRAQTPRRRVRLNVVVHNHSRRPRRRRGPHPSRQRAPRRAPEALHEHDLACHVQAVVVRRVAPRGAVGAQHELGRDALFAGGGRVRQPEDVDGLVVNGKVDRDDLAEGRGEVLLPGAGSGDRGDAVPDVVDRGGVPRQAEGAVAAVGEGDFVEGFEVGHQAVPRRVSDDQEEASCG